MSGIWKPPIYRRLRRLDINVYSCLVWYIGAFGTFGILYRRLGRLDIKPAVQLYSHILQLFHGEEGDGFSIYSMKHPIYRIAEGTHILDMMLVIVNFDSL
jgi:hypothetical protein